MRKYQKNANRSFLNIDSGGILGIVIAMALLLAPALASATPTTIETIGTSIGKVSLKLYVTPGINNGAYATDYQANVQAVSGDETLAAMIGSPVELFCVEDQPAHVNAWETYELFALDTSPDENLWVAWIAENYWNALDVDKGLAQQAIWSILGTVSVTETPEIEAIIAAAKTNANTDILSNWMLAKSATHQDYLVRVPEPATLMLLGTGLLGIGFITRRKIQK